MLSTLASYQMISRDLSKWQATTKAKPEVATATKYYQDHIGSVKSIDDFLKNDRLFSYAMNAFGLGDMTYAKGMMRKVLEGGIKDASSLANKMSDPKFKAFATAFDFVGKGASAATSAATTKDVVNKYVQQTTESDAGDQNEGVRLALYFQRNAPNIKNAYQVLADKALLTVVQTALGIPPGASMQDIDTQAKTIGAKLNMADLQDPAKVQKFVQRFAAMYDMNNTDFTQSNPVLSLFSGSTGGATIGTDLLTSIQGLKLGGYR